MQHNRTFYCPQCFASGRPHVDDRFVSIDSKGRYVVHLVEHTENSNKGFVPHIVTLTESETNAVHFTYICAMHGCGHIVTVKEKSATVLQLTGKLYKGVMPVKDWNALMGYIDHDFDLD